MTMTKISRRANTLRLPTATAAVLRGVLVSILSCGQVLAITTTVSWKFSSVLGL